MKEKKSYFIIERRIYANKEDAVFLDNKMFICNRIYNTGVRHYRKVLERLKLDSRYINAMKLYKSSEPKSDEHKSALKVLKSLEEKYGLREYDIHKYLGYNGKHAYPKCINSMVVQKLGTNLYQSVNKAVYMGTALHYRKQGQTDSFEGKNNTTGIVYKRTGGFPYEESLTVIGRSFKLKPVRQSDIWLQEAMKYKIRYCRIVRKPFKNGYHYFLQLIMEGNPPKKHSLGSGISGVDEGTSTVCWHNDSESGFSVLGEGVEKYEKAINKAARKYERRCRIINPNCYHPDGTPIKGKKHTVHTRGMKKALMELKAAYRKKSEFLKQSHNKLANRLMEQCNTVIKEPMDFRALAKRAKERSRQDKASFIKDKEGNIKSVHKWKRCKRFGSSITRRAPGYFNKTLEEKITRNGGTVIDVDKFKYRASQYYHDTREYKRPRLSDRVKTINGQKVQRDLYSSYLLYCYKDNETIDRDKAEHGFNEFLRRQDIIIKEIRDKQNNDKAYQNFGLKYFN